MFETISTYLFVKSLWNCKGKKPADWNVPCNSLGNPRQSLNASGSGVLHIHTAEQAKCLTANSSLCTWKPKVRFTVLRRNSYGIQHHRCCNYAPNSLSEAIFSSQSLSYFSPEAFLAPLSCLRTDDFNILHSERSSTLARSLQGAVAQCHPQRVMNGASWIPGGIADFIYFIFLSLSTNFAFPYGAHSPGLPRASFLSYVLPPLHWRAWAALSSNHQAAGPSCQAFHCPKISIRNWHIDYDCRQMWPFQRLTLFIYSVAIYFSVAKKMVKKSSALSPRLTNNKH